MDARTGNMLFIVVVALLAVATIIMLRSGIPWYYATMPVYIPVVLVGAFAFLWFVWPGYWR